MTDSIPHTSFQPVIDAAADRYTQERLAYWNRAASQLDTFKSWGGYYHQRLTRIYRRLPAYGFSPLRRWMRIGVPGRSKASRRPFSR